MTAVDRLVSNCNSIVSTLKDFSDTTAKDVTFKWINNDDSISEVSYANIVKFQGSVDGRLERVDYCRRLENSITPSSTITYSEDEYLTWDNRLIAMGVGSDYGIYGANGYINLKIPAVDTVIKGYGNRDDVVVTEDGIPFSQWGSLYYIFEDGQDYNSIDDNWCYVGYDSNTGLIPTNWILVASVNENTEAVTVGNMIISRGRTVHPKLLSNPTNKSYVQSYTEERDFGSGDASILKTFDEVTIQKGKDIELNIFVPTRSNAGDDWGGLYINTNICVNGDWYNLGNAGYDGGAMVDDASIIHNFTQNRIFKLCSELGLTDAYTLQVELTCRSYNSTTYVNKDHDLNRTANNLDSRGALADWAKGMNYTTITIREIDA